MIETTPEHRFASEGRGFIVAGELAIGDRVHTSDGHFAEISAIVPQSGRATVYNLTVETDHTYFVGEGSVWVHNDKNANAEDHDDPHGKNINTP
jgi:hypothetical protein